MTEYGIYLGMATLFVAIVAHAIIATWHVRGMDTSIRADMGAQIDNVQQDVAKLERAGNDRAETLRREFGETGSALRAKIHEVETWSRDNFVRNEQFDKLGDKIEAKIDRLERKIDSLISSGQNKTDGK